MGFRILVHLCFIVSSCAMRPRAEMVGEDMTVLVRGAGAPPDLQCSFGLRSDDFGTCTCNLPTSNSSLAGDMGDPTGWYEGCHFVSHGSDTTPLASLVDDAPETSGTFLLAGAEQASLPQAVCVEQYFGGFGNQMMMLRVAVETAKRLKVPFVKLPTASEDPHWVTIRDVLNLEDVWEYGTVAGSAKPPDSVECIASCAEWVKCRLANGTQIDWKDQLTEGIWRDLIAKKDRLRCNELSQFHKSGKDTLTMHMRSGDVMKSLQGWFGYQKMAPCEFWLQAIQQGSYSSALIVTEPDFQHPCIEVVNRTLPKVIVQSSSLLEDICTLVHSQNLALSVSTFGTTAVELSSTIRTTIAPSWWSTGVFNKSQLIEKCVDVEFPDYPEEFKNWPEKREIILSYPAKKAIFQQKACH